MKIKQILGNGVVTMNEVYEALIEIAEEIEELQTKIQNIENKDD